MNEKQKAFADYYIECLNATESAKKAGYSERSAYNQGQRMMNNDEIKEYIKERMESKEIARVASQDEVLEFLTDVMRGSVKDQLGFETPVKERNRAAELLGKRYKIFEDTKINLNVGVSIVDDIK